jgi:hypothetical protein
MTGVFTGHSAPAFSQVSWVENTRMGGGQDFFSPEAEKNRCFGVSVAAVPRGVSVERARSGAERLVLALFSY